MFYSLQVSKKVVLLFHYSQEWQQLAVQRHGSIYFSRAKSSKNQRHTTPFLRVIVFNGKGSIYTSNIRKWYSTFSKTKPCSIYQHPEGAYISGSSNTSSRLRLTPKSHQLRGLQHYNHSNKSSKIQQDSSQSKSQEHKFQTYILQAQILSEIIWVMCWSLKITFSQTYQM